MLASSLFLLFCANRLLKVGPLSNFMKSVSKKKMLSTGQENLAKEKHSMKFTLLRLVPTQFVLGREFCQAAFPAKQENGLWSFC